MKEKWVDCQRVFLQFKIYSLSRLSLRSFSYDYLNIQHEKFKKCFKRGVGGFDDNIPGVPKVSKSLNLKQLQNQITYKDQHGLKIMSKAGRFVYEDDKVMCLKVWSLGYKHVAMAFFLEISDNFLHAICMPGPRPSL